MKRIERVTVRVRKIMDFGYSDSMEKARIYLESENLNETALIPGIEIDQERMHERLFMMGKNAIFTNITEMDAATIIDFYRKKMY